MSTYERDPVTGDLKGIAGASPTMTGATSSVDGSGGLVPAPAAGDNEKFLRGDGTWAEAGNDTAISSVAQKVSNNNDAYSSTKAYAVGDLCIYNNTLYRCITACSAGSWATNQSCFTADTLTNVVNGLDSALTFNSGVIDDNVIWARWGRIGMVRIRNGKFNSNLLFTLPNEMTPLTISEIVDTYSKKRIIINDDCTVTSTDTFTNTIIRGTITYILKSIT